MYDEKEIFEFLDDLRESGVTNMFGAPAYLQHHFGMTRRESFDWTKKWMETFSERQQQALRVK